MKTIMTRAITYILGLTILSFSISLLIKSGLGTGAWDALNVGLAYTIGLTVGTWVFIVGIILIGINALLMKAKPDFLAIITVVILGSLIDFWLLVVYKDWVPEGLLVQSLVFTLGLFLLALGVAIYLQAHFAPVPIDKLMIAIHNRTGLNLMLSKTIGEVIALIAAWIFGGPIGVGTLLVTILIGPLVQLLYPRIESLVKHLQHA